MTNLLYTMSSTGWDVTTFLTNAISQIKSWFDLLFVIIGMGALAFGIMKVFKSLKTPQQAEWGIALGFCILGGFMIVSKFGGVVSISSGASKTLEDLGGTEITDETPSVGQTIIVDDYLVTIAE